MCDRCEFLAKVRAFAISEERRYFLPPDMQLSINQSTDSTPALLQTGRSLCMQKDIRPFVRGGMIQNPDTSERNTPCSFERDVHVVLEKSVSISTEVT